MALSGRATASAAASGATRHPASRRLDQPRAPRRRLLPEYDPEAFGRLSERIARFLGTGRFIVWMTVVIILWVLWNIAAPSGLRFDEYPFIFLTLMLSLQASYAAPLILLAQNRQDDRDRVNHEQDRKQNERSIADTEYLSREIAALRIGPRRGRHAGLDPLGAAGHAAGAGGAAHGHREPAAYSRQRPPGVTKATAEALPGRGARRRTIVLWLRKTRCAKHWRR